MEYSCKNFDDSEKNRLLIKQNLLYNHDTLPLGEFAIGTNTTAYVMAKKFGIIQRLPILIVEKMGPHFAVGDTCYSRSEDHKLYNPDGKEIIARDNEISLLRKTEPDKAYYNCHTDISVGSLNSSWSGTKKREAVYLKKKRFSLSRRYNN